MTEYNRFASLNSPDFSEWYLREDDDITPGEWILPIPWIAAFFYTHCKANFWSMLNEGDDRTTILQIGCAEGGDSVEIAKILKLPMIDGVIHVVDWFRGNLTVEEEGWAYNLNNVKPWKTHFNWYAKKNNVDDIITIFEGDSREVVPTLNDNFYDMVFIDGGHEYDIVKSDIEHGWKKLKSGGIMIFDDLSSGYQEYLDYDLKNAPSEVINVDTFKFPDGKRFHAGVVKAVYEFFEADKVLRVPYHDKAYVFKP